MWALLRTSRTRAQQGETIRDARVDATVGVLSQAYHQTEGAATFSGAAAAANELNMEVDEEGSSSALDAAAAAAELDVVRRKAAAVDALVRSGELPAEVQTTLDEPPQPLSRNAHPVIRFSADRDVAEFKVQLDDEGWATARSPLRFHRPLTEGAHSLRVAAVDLHGLADPTPASVRFRIDLTAPSLAIQKMPSDPSNQVPAPFVVCADEDHCEMRWSLDVPYASSTNSSSGEDPPGASEPPPPAALVPTGKHGRQQGSGEAAAARQRWMAATELEAQVEVNHTSTRCTALRVPGLVSGTYRFRIAAKDPAGNMAKPRTVVWRVDLEAPETRLLSGPTGRISSTAATMVMRAPGEPTGGYSFQYRYDSFPGLLHAPRLRNGPRRNATGAETSDWVTGSQWSTDHAKFSLIGDTLSMSQLPDGPHKIEVRAVDAARNVDPTPVVHEFVVHLKPPDTTFVDPPPLVTCGPHARFKVACSHSQCMYEYKLDGHAWKWAMGEGVMWRGTLELRLSDLSQGKHHLQVRSTDATGEREARALVFKWSVGVCYDTPPAFDTVPPLEDSSDVAALTRDSGSSVALDEEGQAERVWQEAAGEEERGDEAGEAAQAADEDAEREEEQLQAAEVFEVIKPKQNGPTRPKAIEWRGGHVRSSIGRWEGGVHAGAVTETNSFHDQVS